MSQFWFAFHRTRYDITPLLEPCVNKKESKKIKLELRNDRFPDENTDPYSLFLYAMRSPKTKEKCIGRLRMFLDHINIPGDSMETRCKLFCEQAKVDTSWAFRNIVSYLQKQKERVENKEITAGTLKNRFQVIKSCCDMNNIDIPWRMISRGLPRVKKSVL